MDRLFSIWDSSNPAVMASLSRDIAILRSQLLLIEAELLDWYKRQNTEKWEDVRRDRRLLLPNQVYTVVVDGAPLKVRFSREVVQNIFWSKKDVVRETAAVLFLQAISHGIGQMKNSIRRYPDYGGHKIFKVHITGRAHGRYRIFGILDRGVMSFVHWAHEDKHDASYVQAVSRATVDRYSRESWD